jgi:Carboxypeptidase regulatory-like domain
MFSKILRGGLGVAVALTIVLCQENLALASATGQITGRVVDASTNAPIVGAMVTAVSPTGSYKAVTASNGYYAMVDVYPDTYRITVTAEGYSAALSDGNTVNQNVSTSVDFTLTKTTTVLGHVTVRGVTTVVQPSVPADQYVLTASAANATNGSGGSMSLYQTPGIIATLPGVTLDAGGYSHIRGSRFDEVGYEYDGLTTVEPITGTFSTNLVEDGASRLQVSTGGYSADGGSAISGVVNTVVGVGTYPPRGSITTLVQAPTFYHGLNFDYGSATPDGRFSWYVAAVTWNSGYDWGNRGTFYPSVMNFESAAGVGDLGSVVPSRDQVVNLHYKFGQNLGWDLQYLGTTGIEHYNNIILPAFFPSSNPLDGTPAVDPQPVGGICDNGMPLFPGQTTCTEIPPPGSTEHDDQGYFIDKLQLTHNFSSNSSLSVHYARVGSYVTFWFPFGGGSFDDIYENRHSDQQEAEGDYTIQAGSENLVKLGADHIYSTNFLYALFTSFAEGEVVPTNNADNSYWIADTFKPGDRLTLDISGRRDTRTFYRVTAPTFTDAANQLRGGLAYELGQNTVIRATDGNFASLPNMSRAERIFTFGYPFFNINQPTITRDAQPDVPESHSYDLQIEQDLGHGLAFKGGPFWRRTDNLILTFRQPNQPASLPQAVGPYDVNGIETELQFNHAGNFSGYIDYTHTRALAAVTGDFEPSLPPGAQFYHALFPASFVPPNAANLVLEWKHGKWDINPVINYSSGFPYGTGLFTYNNFNCPTGSGPGDPSKPCGAIVKNEGAYSDVNQSDGLCDPGFCKHPIDPGESLFADGRVCCTSLVANLNLYYNVSPLTTVGLQWQNLNRDYRPTALEQNFTWPSGNNGYLNYGTDPYFPSAINGSEEFLFTLVQKI